DEQQQAALAELLARRDPGRAAAARLRQSRNADRNNFIDGLWRLGGDYADAQVRQGMLDLTVTGTVSQARCVATARLMQGVPTYLTRIRLRDGSGRRSASCAVPHSVEAPLVSAAFLSETDTIPLTPAAFQIDTIDASVGATDGDPQARTKAIRAALTAENIFVMAVSLTDSDLTLYYANYHYQMESDALDRIVRVLSKEAPPNIERFRLIAVNAGVPVQEFDVLRSPAERSYQQEDQLLSHALTITPPAMDQPALTDAAADIYPRFTWGLYPQLRQALFDPNRPLGIQLVAAVGGGVELAPGLSLLGSVDVSIFDTFDTSRASDSVLPHVRSDFLKYFSKGKTGIANLEADYRFRVAPTVFGRVRTGYLESMFAGAGGEILWRPENARWALGADIYEVWQRDFDRLLGLQHYRQTTGHVSLYYDSPWYNLNFQLRAGQYLAGDRGVTLQVTRRFSTGVEIGAFVTKTNVSASAFGEGSFDKGLIIRIPLGWVAPLETQSQIAMDLRPVQRDGGQTLGGDATLFDETRMTSEG
ncbi:MAG TPA: YjbH domain-containing protein, partial [Rhizomicrobium sp.]